MQKWANKTVHSYLSTPSHSGDPALIQLKFEITTCRYERSMKILHCNLASTHLKIYVGDYLILLKAYNHCLLFSVIFSQLLLGLNVK